MNFRAYLTKIYNKYVHILLAISLAFFYNSIGLYYAMLWV